MVAVAQLVRASVCGTEGRGFKSRQPPHFQVAGDLRAPTDLILKWALRDRPLPGYLDETAGTNSAA